MTEADVSVGRSTPAPHGGERPYSFLHSVGSALVYCYWCTNVGFVSLSTSPTPWIAITLTANHRWLCLQWAHEHRAWHADWHQVVFSDESRFTLWDHDGRICVRRYAGDRCLPECVIEQYNGLISRVMVWDVIFFHGPPNLLRVEGNLSIALGTSLRC
ncbi:transposable element Tcb1 transposase [Trichonephila clavipes]|nr:transposable element Tcb1 transposase [Trichonephila clavipes]